MAKRRGGVAFANPRARGEREGGRCYDCLAMNDNAQPGSASVLDTLVGTVFTRLPHGVLNLMIDQLPDAVYRVALEAHEFIVRVSDAALTHGEMFATRLRRKAAR
jgi:hypothetical protein